MRKSRSFQMKGNFLKFLFPLLLLILFFPPHVLSQTTSGTIQAPGEIWDHTMNPIIITGDITIPDGRFLDILHGCDIRFQENSDDTHWGWDIRRSEIIVYGSLNIDGTLPGGCTGPVPGDPYTLIDNTTDFVAELVGPGAIIKNITKASDGVVTGIGATNDTLLIAGGMKDANGVLVNNDAGDAYVAVVPATLTSTGTGSEGWFGIVFSDNTADGNIKYSNIDHSVYGINFTACSILNPPSVVSCTINDVTKGIYFDNDSSPEIRDTTIISASTAFSCWAFSAPSIVNCNATGLVGEAMAVYATEDTNPEFIGCAFSTGSVELDRYADVYAQDTTISDSVLGVIGKEFKSVIANKVLSFCRMELDNCNVIGPGNTGQGITWDDNLDMLKVEYSRIGGFMRNAYLRWGSYDPGFGIFHPIGIRFSGAQITGICDINGGTYQIIDTTTDFVAEGAFLTMAVENITDASTGTVTGISTTINANDTLNIALGMSGGAPNDVGDVYTFLRVTGSSTLSGSCSGGTFYMLFDSYTDFVAEGVSPGAIVTNMTKSPAGTCDGGGNTQLIDYYKDFMALDVTPTMTVTNTTDSSTGLVTGFATTWNLNDTLVIGAGMSGGATNDPGEEYYVFYTFGFVTGIASTVSLNDTLEIAAGMSPLKNNEENDWYTVEITSASNNADFGDMGNWNPYRNWPAWYTDYSDGENEFYGVQNPICLFNVACEQGGAYAPNLYQIDAWAENNWWITTNESVISRYVWDNVDYPLLGLVWAYQNEPVYPNKRTYSVSGRILDNLGDAVGGVRVWVDISAVFPGRTVLADISGGDGYYTIYGLLPGTYSVTPDKLYYSFNPPLHPITITDSDITGYDFDATLPPPRVLSVARTDGEDGGDFGLSGRTNWGKNSETTWIDITGLNFRETPSVFLRGPLPAATDTALGNVVWETSTNLTAYVPAGMTTGNYSVRVVNPDGQEVIWGNLTYSSTCSNDGGNVLLIDTSTNFSDEQVGRYAYLSNDIDGSNGIVTALMTVTNPNDTLIISNGMSGGADNDAGDAYTVYVAPAFTIVPPPPPVVNSINPPLITTEYDDWLTVTGENFLMGCDLTIDGVTWSNREPGGGGTSISAYHYPGTLPAGTWSVVVTNPDSQTSNDNVTITVQGPPPPVVTSIVPDHGANNRITQVDIYGSGFDATPDVLIGTTSCINETYVSSSHIEADVPIGITPGTYDVTVTNPDGQSGILTNGYTVDEPALGVIGISPPMGLASGDTDIIIVGENIKSTATVDIGGTNCPVFRIVSTTCLQAIVPSGMTAGLYNVTIDNNDGQPANTLSNGYTSVTTSTVSSPIVPDNGDANDTTAITINGSDFAYIPRVEIDTATATRCTDVVFVSSSQLTANVPSGLAPGTYTVTVINPLNQSGTGGTYTVNAASAGEPVVTSILPSTGTNNSGTDITITGSNFTGATSVTVGATACTNVTVVSDTELTATVPAGIMVGDCDLIVTNAAGTGTSTHGFTVGGSGTLNADTTLSGNVNLTGDVVVPDGVTLTIEPSSILMFDALSDDTSGGWDGERGEVRVYGRLNILGDADVGRVALTSNGGRAQDWLGIVLSDTTASCWIEHADITNTVYGFSFESSLSTPITADDPRPWVRNIYVANSLKGIALNSSVGFTCPAVDSCSIDGATTGISAGGTAAPIFTLTLLRNISSVGLEGRENAIVTIENSSMVDASKAVSCQEAGAGEETNASIVNVIFSVLGNGAIELSDSASLTARMVTHLVFPGLEQSTGITGTEAASMRWDYSNVVQGYPDGTGIDWQSAGNLSVSNSVIEGWGTGVMRRSCCGDVNLGDSAATGGNEFLGILNPEAAYNVANNCSGDMSARYNWWLTTDTSVIENYLYDEDDDPNLGNIDYSDELAGPRTYSVAGRITDMAGNGIDRAQVVARHSTAHTDNDRMGMTDEDGYYTIYGLVPGDYTIESEKQEHWFDPADISLAVTDTDINGQDFTGHAPPPVIYGITPDWGYNNVSTGVIITGLNFRNGAYVYLRGPLPGSSAETTLTNVQWVSSTTITASVQGGFCAGGYAVRVMNPDGQSAYWIDEDTPSFTAVNPIPPIIHNVSPSAVWQDNINVFLIDGENFYGPPTVCFGQVCTDGEMASHYEFYYSWSETQLTIRVPANYLECVPNEQDIIVVNPAPPCEMDGVSSNPFEILVTCPLPTPTAPPPNTPTPTPTTPMRAIGLAPPLGLATPVQTPSVMPGTDIVLVGRGMSVTPAPTVRIMSSPPAGCFNLRPVSSTAILATVPDGIAPGTYDIEVDNDDGQPVQTIPSAYSVVAPPTVTSVTINSGGGYNNATTNITINGSNFAYIPKVEIGTTRCVDVQLVSSTELNANVPSGITAGAYDLTVINPLDQAGTLAGGYTVLDPPAGQPIITSISPATGVNNTITDITIIGSDFPAGPDVYIGSTPCTNVVWVDATQITATVPSSAGGLRPGDYNVRVTDGGAISGTMTKGFTMGGSGTIRPGNWSISRSISLTGDLVVPDDVVLTINPGVMLTFASVSDDTSGGWDNERGEIRVYGRLNILGEVNSRVALTSNGAQASDWLGIVFSDTLATGLIEYADISNGTYGIWFKSCLAAAAPGNPIPRVHDTTISTCGTGLDLGPSSGGNIAPSFDRCDIGGVSTGVKAEGQITPTPVPAVSAPILTTCDISGASSTGISGSGCALITAWVSSVSESSTAVSCALPSSSAVNLIFSAISDGKARMEDTSSLTGRTATIAGATSGVTGNDDAILDWAYSNVVQGGFQGTGVDWDSVGGCAIRYSVIESWGTGVSGYGSVVNLGDGSADTGHNDFIGNADYNVENTGGGTLPARYNWWLSTDPLVIESLLSGDVDYSNYLTEPRTYSVAGTITDDYGQALAGVRVATYYLPREPFTNRDNDRIALTDENGDYKIFGLISGDYTIEPEKVGYTFDPLTISIRVVDTDITGQDFTVDIPPPSVYGIRRANGAEYPPYGNHWAFNNVATEVVITGINFRDGADAYLIGPLPATTQNAITNVQFDSSTRLTATVQSGFYAAGYGIMVTNPDGQSDTWGDDVSNPAFTILDPPAPVVYWIDPSEIQLGGFDPDDAFHINGDYFFGQPSIFFGSVAGYYHITGLDPDPEPTDKDIYIRVSQSDLQSMCDMGPQVVQVFNPDGQGSNTDVTLTVNGPPAPEVTSIDPASGDNDRVIDIDIEGSAFQSTPDVYLAQTVSGTCSGGGTLSLIDITTDFVTAGVSVGMTVLNVNDGSWGVITGISTTMNPNDTLDIAGAMSFGDDNSSGDSYSVILDEYACINETWVSSSEITAQVPAGIPAGTYDVIVWNPPCNPDAKRRYGVLPGGYMVTQPDVAVVGISPPLGLASADTDVIVVGKNIKESPGPTVTIGATACTNVRVVSTTCLMATVPSPIATGLYAVTVDNNDGQPAATLANAYTVVTTPTVSAPIVPASGDANDTTAITINGADFAYIPHVEIGTTPATRCTDVVFVSSAQLTANVPAGIAPGTYDVTVINPLNQTGTLAGSYTVNAVPAGEPEVTSVDPPTGTNNADTDVAITGAAFTGTTGVTVGVTACTNVTVVSDTEITATVPAGIMVGDCDLTVTNATGTGTSTHGFTVGGSGTLDADTTLSGPVDLTGDIVVPDGVTLTVEPGSLLKFKANSDDTSGGWDGTRGEIRVYGRINVLGDEGERVALTSDGGAASDWLGIVFSDTTASGWIEYADITSAVYGLSFESSLSTPITADNPRPWVQNINIANCSTGVSLNSSVGFTCPAIDACSIDNATTGISAGGTAAPIFTTTLFRNVSSVGLEGKENSIVTMENSSIVDAPKAVCCPEAENEANTNASRVNVIFSVLGNGSIDISDSSCFTARMVTHLLFPGKQVSYGILGEEAASLDWDFSNLVQGYAEGTGIDWQSAGGLYMSYSVVEGWDVGIKRSEECGIVNLGDGLYNLGFNEFLGIMNSGGTLNLNVYNLCSSYINARFNWWLTTDHSVIENYLSGPIDYSFYLSLPRTYSVAGRITDHGGSGVDRVQVVAYYSTSYTDNDRMGMTDDDGYYKIYGLIPGDYTIDPEKQGYTFTPASLPVTVSNTDINGQDFTANLAPPTVYGIRRADGQMYPPYGNHWAFNNEPTEVVITGINFRDGATSYLVGPLPATTQNAITNVQFDSSTMLTATVQAGFDAAGYGIMVANPDGQSDTWGDNEADPAFTILDPPAPEVYWIDPSTVTADSTTVFHIHGMYFWGFPDVFFGAEAGYYYTVGENPDPEPTETDIYIRLTDSQLLNICGPQPDCLENVVQVFNPDGQGSNTDVTLTVCCPLPTPTPPPPDTPTPTPPIPLSAIGLAPPLGLATPVPTPSVTPGTDIVLVGKGMSVTPAPTVRIMSSPPAGCFNIRPVSSTALLATIPDGIAPGTYDIEVDNDDGQGPQTISSAYSVIAPPAVTSAVINSGGGYNNATTNITINGSDFAYIPKVEIGTTRCVDVQLVSSTELNANVPSGITAGAYDVTVINPLNQTGTLAGGYTVLDPPTGQPVILSVSPSTGVNSEETDIAIIGLNFPASPTVRVGSTTCTNVERIDSEKITATVPSSIIGLLPRDYDITVTDLVSNSATMTKGFTMGGSGTLNADDWTISRSISLTGDLVVPEDATLTIYPGATLTFAADSDDTSGGWDNERGEIRLYGRLNMLGEVDNRVSVTSDGSGTDDWLGIVFSDTGATGLIEYADISNADYGLWFKSCLSTAAAGAPIPRALGTSITNCYNGVDLGASLSGMAPTFDRCEISSVSTGVSAAGWESTPGSGVSAPILTSSEISVSGGGCCEEPIGFAGDQDSIITGYGSAVLMPAAAPTPAAAISSDSAAFNLIFSASTRGKANLSGTASLTGRMATISRHPTPLPTPYAIISGADNAMLDLAYSNVVQGTPGCGVKGVDWGSAAACTIRCSVIESWGTGVSGYGSGVNLGDGSFGAGHNDFIGNTIYNVENKGGGTLSAQYNWWMSEDPMVIELTHSGDVDYSNYLGEPCAYSVEGSVTDSSDQPLAGARVVAYCLPREPFENRDNDRMALADEDGDYKLFGLVPGDYSVELILNSGMSTSQYVKIVSTDITGVDLVKGYPLVTSITPDNAANTGTVTTTIRGNFFETGCVVKLMREGVDAVKGQNYTVTPSDNRIDNCEFNLNGVSPERWDVVVTNSDNTTGRLTAGFLITGNQPTVTGISPNSMAYGDEETVTITGTNFYSTSRITIGPQELTNIVCVSLTEIKGDVGIGIGSGYYDVTVTNGDEKSATLTNGFYVVPPAGGNVIVSEVVPNGGSPGDDIRVYGSGFAGIPDVVFNPGEHQALSEVLISSTEIYAVVPSGLTIGTWYDITVNNLDPSTGQIMDYGSLAHAFRYGNPPATVTWINPDYGVNTGTTDVIVEGSDFKDGLTMSIGGKDCTVEGDVLEARFHAIVPAGINPGYHDVVVTNEDADPGSLRYGFRVDADTDDDQMGDGWEYQYFNDLDENGSDDYDGDGFSNLEEYRNGTDPTQNSDIDGDGLPDYWEDRYGLDKYDPADANLDPDGDGFTNLEEFLANHRGGTDPMNDESVPDAGADWDEDGLENSFELTFGLDPKSADGADGGGGDPDGDGYTNAEEALAGSNPLNPNSSPDNPDVMAGTLAVLKRHENGDQNIYFYNTARPGDWSFGEALSRNPSAAAVDLWLIPSGNNVSHIAAIDTDADDTSEFAVLRVDNGDDPNIYIYSAPAYGERTYGAACARNPSPLARDFWVIPEGDIVAMASVDADGDGVEEAAVLKRSGDDVNLFLYTWPAIGDYFPADAEARNVPALARDLWVIPSGNDIAALAAIDTDGDDVDELAIVRREDGWDYNIYIYRCPEPGDWTYWDAFSRNPSPMCRDLWIIPAGNDVSGMCAMDVDMDGVDELMVLKSTYDGDLNLYTFEAPAEGDWSYYDAGVRNPSPLARDLWIIPAGNDIEEIISIR